MAGRDAEAGLVVPRASSGRRSPRPARRRTGLARLIGGLGMLALALTLLWLLTDETFHVTATSVSVEGVRYAREADIRDQIQGLDRVPNVFRVRASEFVSGIRSLPQVISASAVITLPADVSVHIKERQPRFRWTDGKQAWLVDDKGVLFAQVPLEPDARPAASPDPAPSDPAPSDPAPSDPAPSDPAPLPQVEDHRLLAEPLSVGAQLPHLDLAVMQQLLALTPELLGSRSGGLVLSIDQADGYVLRSDLGWQAVFGHYTPTIQPPEVVARQVQCLSWLLASRERRLERVRLAVSPDGCGTFTRSGGRN